MYENSYDVVIGEFLLGWILLIIEKIIIVLMMIYACMWHFVYVFCVPQAKKERVGWENIKVEVVCKRMIINKKTLSKFNN